MDNSELTAHFKAAALAVTNLFKDAQKQQKDAFETGYSQCLDDVWRLLNETRDINQLTAFLVSKKQSLSRQQSEQCVQRETIAQHPVNQADVAAQTHAPEHGRQGSIVDYTPNEPVANTPVSPQPVISSYQLHTGHKRTHSPNYTDEHDRLRYVNAEESRKYQTEFGSPMKRFRRDDMSD